MQSSSAMMCLTQWVDVGMNCGQSSGLLDQMSA
jgi:hypothetical protein